MTGDTETDRDLRGVTYDSSNAFAAVGYYGTILLDGEDNVRRVDGMTIQLYSSIDYPNPVQTAYSAVQNDNAFIEVKGLHFYGDLNFSGDKIVSLVGGYDTTFSQNLTYTTLNGSLTIGGDGTVVVENLIIQ